MIKVLAFDFVGVLGYEKDVEMTEIEEKLERMYGPIINDEKYFKVGRRYINNDDTIIRITKNLINRLYGIRYKNLFQKIKELYPDIKVVIATNHVSYIREFLEKRFDIKYLDDIIISAEINKAKPNDDFYEYIFEKYNIKPNELLFIDDREENVDAAINLGINAIKYNSREMDLLETVLDLLKR